ncbi:N-acetylglucosaminephosphotransferase [Dacryopinax primogenitus]|uniref:UDP-N-acetylglucosamine--dolichyl-phosphate N-acetylglucosaminephosphotransferase n=1 Tax=Dacryopinax primogenitus (strain DJM 731) TaxID=1858805 RepID=M5FYP9_DACPD|nr:N-acetylglucosaminephosphotransferase [Dacryopinax primogenitus]EJT98666.1 N-acetylglucosaminephosphotransferase [Dacryopinax primogenitus]
MPPPRRLPRLLTISLLPLSLALILRPLLKLPSSLALPALETNLGFAILAFVAVVHLIPALGENFIKAGLKGRDMLKTYDDPIPECQGLICAAVYITLLTLFIPFPFSSFFARDRDTSLAGLAKGDFPHQQLATYLSALLSFLAATMLGLLDDLFDIRWRYKLPIPIIASIPLLMVYYAEQGLTTVVLPIPLRPFFGTIVQLGPLYYVYMSLLSTFCTNAINILAGINGVEVGQALIISLSVALNDLLYLPWPYTLRVGSKVLGGEWGAGLAFGSKELVERHLLSLYFMLPLIGVCAGLMFHNWYPARAFPGDTLCYFTGMAIAAAGILGHFSKTLLLFFIPQIFNFLLSCPQLFLIVPCPRHRLPKLNKDTMLLNTSEADLSNEPPSSLRDLVLQLLAFLRLTRLTTDLKTGRITACTNLTILNVLLYWFGPMSEEDLVVRVMLTQCAGSALAFVVRYGVAGLIYDGDRR